MSKVDKLLMKGYENTMSVSSVITDTRHFHLGDEVKIPDDRLMSVEHGKRVRMIPATVIQITGNIIVFQLKNGLKESLRRFDCQDIVVTKSSNFGAYPADVALEDIQKGFVEAEVINE